MANVITGLWRLVYGVVLLLHFCTGHSYFATRIPNGDKVPNPCRSEETWVGVGHKLIGGSGARNSFGLDFADNGLTWTKSLCEEDSDLDGLTNGQELGDPNCTWSQGMPAPTGYTISHPGICDPWNDPACFGRDQDWVMENCQPSGFKCDGIKSAGVLTKTLRIPRTPVPPRETTYMCQIFTIPNDTDYHIIATTPIINNTKIVHHVVLFGCTEDAPERVSPYRCGMLADRHCVSFVSLWTPGSAGDCIHSSAGFRMGSSGFKKVALQLHWNNPALKDDYFDESGMVIHFTPNLRENDASILTTGQTSLLIPPGEPLVQAKAVYPADCSREDLVGNIQVTAVLNHMHYLGIHQFLELYRGGVKIRDIAVDPHYNYDNPQIHTFDEPIEVRPGDELRTRCDYSSTRLTHTTIFGDATSDEMCYSFITFYPKQNSRREFATSHNTIPTCRLSINDVYEGCNFKTFPNLSDPLTLKLFTQVTTKCELFEECTQDCYEAVQSVKQHKCLQGDIWTYVIYRFFRSKMGLEFLARLQSCECGIPEVTPPPITPISTEQSTCDWPGLVKANKDHPVYQQYVNIISKCIATGQCLKECVPAVKEARGHRCFQGAEWHYGRRYLHQSSNSKALEFLLDFESCNCVIGEPDWTTDEPNVGTTDKPQDGTTDTPTDRISEKPIGSAPSILSCHLVLAGTILSFAGTIVF